jgi:hypothetical protein
MYPGTPGCSWEYPGTPRHTRSWHTQVYPVLPGHNVGGIVLCRSGLAFYLMTQEDIGALDVQPSIQRLPASLVKGDKQLILTTIMPSSKIVLIKQARILTGFECLRLQGFDEATLKEYVQHAKRDKHVAMDAFLQDLAGNAWSGPTIMAVIMAVLIRCTDDHRALYGMTQRAASSSDVAVVDEVLGDILRL